MQIRTDLKPSDLTDSIHHMWRLSAEKIRRLEARWNPSDGAPVFTVRGEYTTRGWTEWTQGFQFGSALLQFDATGDREILELGRTRTVERMAPHVTHFGVHDHGFNNVSTYGNLLRLMNEGRIEEDRWERAFYEMALKCSGAVQARRWTSIHGGGYIHSFNGPHSLFVDTMRSLRSLALAHRLGHELSEEHDCRVSLLDRLLQHAIATATHNVYYGEGRDAYDVRGRVAHESIFNATDGHFRCPSSQQGYSPFTTWTRGLAWAMLGFAEELEFLETAAAGPTIAGPRASVVERHLHEGRYMLRAARATCDYYIDQTPADGVPYWDTGAPGLVQLGDYLARPADPYNDFEPVDSSAAAIAAQGLLRLGRLCPAAGDADDGARYMGAGLTVAQTLLAEPYLSGECDHEGLLLHSVYHRPNGWDYVPPGHRVPCGESSMWGDYHLRELALYIGRLARSEPYYTFFGPA